MTDSAYVHIPFCTHKCDFCEFAAFAGVAHLEDEYSRILCDEIRARTKLLPNRNSHDQLSSVYFGGGTPGLAATENIEKILSTLCETLGIAQQAEITLETTPHAISMEKARRWQELGINRLSIGIESLHDSELAAIGRDHTHAQAVQGVRLACQAGFDNISCDFMYALPTQTEQSWRQTLAEFLDLAQQNPQIKHVSAYALTLSANSPLYSRFPKQSPQYPADDTFADMYDALVEMLPEAGFEHYEVSNFAKQGYRCRHNLVYWNNDDYHAFGVGAHRYIGGVRSANWRSLRKYMTDPLSDEYSEVIDDSMRLKEAILLGLRMCEGLDLRYILQEFGVNLEQSHVELLNRLKTAGFIELSNHRLRLTEKGIPVSNSIITELI